MLRVKESLIALIGIVILVGSISAMLPLVGRGQGQNPFAPRRFYLTREQAYKGNQAVTACAAGFHMASMWEILDPSNLKYDTTLGATLADSGFGPPTRIQTSSNIFNRGWIRTGGRAQPTGAAGTGNCAGWNSDLPNDNGTAVELPPDWNVTSDAIAPWFASPPQCSTPQQVWCVEDQ
jgi:hypothetical protein